MKRMLLLALLTVVLAQLSWASIPRTLSFQGILTDNNGVVLPDGNYSVTFRIYDLALGGSHLWEETQSVAVVSGRFNVILGTVTSLDPLPFDDPYWLATKVGADPEMTPRVELTSSAYSLNSRSAVCCPGVANDSNAGPIYFSPGVETFAARTITVPSSGYVLAIATGSVVSESAGDELILGVSENESVFTGEWVWVGIPDHAGDCEFVVCYTVPVTTQTLFEVTPGSHTYYFIGEPAQGGGPAYVKYATLSLIFLPEAMGTVEPAAPAGE